MDLINPKSTLSGNQPVLKETRHWYLPLDKHEPFLKKWILEDHKEWKANVYGQCKSWLDAGLQPRAVSRDLDWGVPVPVDGAEGKVLYVWFDAPIGYISNTIEWAEQNGKDWKKYWQDEDAKLVHFIGKDNIVFHCIIFPAMLKSHGNYILPENVPGNEFLNLEGDKISTSRNWAVWLHEYLVEFPGKQDVLRYVLAANMPETKDNDFTWKDFQARNNNELVAILGNFINRTAVLTQKYYDRKVPSLGELQPIDQETIAEMAQHKERIESSLENYRFREALKEAMNLARLGNKYLADTEPWKLIKTDEARVETIMNICIQLTANLSIVFEPFMPFTAQKIRQLLHIESLGWEKLGQMNLLAAGHLLDEPFLLFDKIEDEAIEAQVQKLEATRQSKIDSTPAVEAKELVSYDDFTKLDIRTGTILEAEKVAKTKKLLKLLVDTGIDKRTVVSGIAEYYNPEELKGKKVSILVNLAPRSIKGIESQGMILMAENADGSLSFVSSEKEVNNGSEIK
jgi:methionyl-tRNA synthetase